MTLHDECKHTSFRCRFSNYLNVIEIDAEIVVKTGCSDMSSPFDLSAFSERVCDGVNVAGSDQ